MTKTISVAVISAFLLTALSACTQTDVIAKYAIASFDEVTTLSDVTKDPNLDAWSLKAPDGSARFLFSSDFKATAPYDVMLETDAQPFIDAGLDVTKLPAGMFADNMILVGQSLGDQAFTATEQETPEASLGKLIELNRNVLGYHEAMGHYGIDLGNGNKFEWAKDLAGNDKDLVFILDPQVFIDAGTDVANIRGWVFGKVEVMDKDGNNIQVEKLLKPFNLK